MAIISGIVWVLSLSFAFLVAGQVTAVPPIPPGNDCGSAGQWEVPRAPEGAKLVQVQAIIRFEYHFLVLVRECELF